MVDWPLVDEFKDTLVASQGPPIDLLQAKRGSEYCELLAADQAAISRAPVRLSGHDPASF